MLHDLIANPATVETRAGGRAPLSSMCHEVGLAAVAAKLHLPISELDLESAEAVERGAAVLFLAGVGPGLTKPPRRGRTGEDGGGRKMRRASTETSRSANPRATKLAMAADRSPIAEPSASR